MTPKRVGWAGVALAVLAFFVAVPPIMLRSPVVVVALALAALAAAPDVRPIVEERERLAEELRRIGLESWPSRTNFLYVPLDDALAVYESLLRRGLLVRPYEGAIRITVRDARDDDRIVAALTDR